MTTATAPVYSVVIPVFNSAGIVGDTIDQTLKFFDEQNLDAELILVNDGSTDSSWDVLGERALADRRIVAVNLLRNYGQHNANLCGFRLSRGEFVVTMDDDLQNPPDQIRHLIDKANEGYDLVVGRFREKKHSLFRRFGTMLIDGINQKIFQKPPDLVLSNFRIIRRDVIERVCAYKTSYPYVPGLCLMFSNRRANALVEHAPRRVGKSNYTLARILNLVLTILFNYSSYPLRFVGVVGLVVSSIGFLLGTYYLLLGLFRGSTSPGWLTLVVLVSFLSSTIILMLSMVGEYLIRLVNQSSSTEAFHVKEIVRVDD